MPNPLLFNTLLQRQAPTGPDPNQPVGTGQETMLDKGLSALGGAIGLPPGPDNPWRRGGALLGAAMPILGAAGKAVGFPQVLQDLFASNPQARSAYEAAQDAQMAENAGGMTKEGLTALLAKKQAQKYGEAAQTHDALLDLAHGGGGSGTPRTIPTPTGFTIPIPKDAKQQPSTPMSVREFAGALAQEGNKPIAEAPFSLTSPENSVTAGQYDLFKNNVPVKNGKTKMTPAIVRALDLFKDQ